MCVWGGGPASLDPAGSSYFQWCLNRCYVLLTPDPPIPGVLECLGVEPLLDAVGLGAEFVPNVANLSFLIFILFEIPYKVFLS